MADRLKRELFDRAVEIARRSLEAGPLAPRFSLPEGVTLRCAAVDEAMWRDKFVAGTPIEVDLQLAAGQMFAIVTVAPIAKHISVTIGFHTEPRRG